MYRHLIHYGIHFIIPIVIGLLLFKHKKIKITLILLGGILIDVDHLLAEPIFEVNRCSIGFHPLHSYIAIGCYTLLFLIKKTRVLGLALLIHIIADFCDCLLIGFQS